MELINQIIMMVMMSFMAVAAVDRILNQFGGAEAVLGRIGLGALGRSFAGSGASSRKVSRPWVRSVLPWWESSPWHQCWPRF